MQICVGEDEIDLDMDDLNITQTAVDSGLAVVKSRNHHWRRRFAIIFRNR